MIVLDSNQLRQAAPPDGALLSLLRKLGESSGHVLAIPQMVLDEYLGFYEYEVQEALDALHKAARKLSRQFEQDISGQVPRLDAAEAVQRRQKSIEDVFTILPTPDGAEHEALIREIRRLRPATLERGNGKGGGARDVVIWLTILNAEAHDGEVLFLSQDGDFGSAAGWHPDLAAEISGASLRLLHDGISQLIAELATPASAPADIMALLRDPVITGAVASFYVGPDVFFALVSQVTTPSGGPGIMIGSSAPTMTPVEQLGQAHAYSVDEVTWLSIRVRWQADKEYTITAGSSAGVGGPIARPISWPSRWSASVQFEVENTLLIEINQDGEPVSAEVTRSGILQFRDLQASG
jgi:hypothetical protein